MISNRITSILAVATALLTCAACQTKYPTYDGPDHIIFSQESYDLGVIDNQEWFEIPVSATRTAEGDRVLGVEIVDAQSSAVEGLHYELESIRFASRQVSLPHRYVSVARLTISLWASL